MAIGSVYAGRRGPQGVGVESASINGSSHLILSLDNGTDIDAGPIPSTGGSTITSTQITDSTSIGRAVLTAATQAAARAAIGAGTGSGAGLSDGDYGDWTISGSGTVATIDNDAVTFAKMQNVATDIILGRDTGGTGNIEELSASAVRGIINVDDVTTGRDLGNATGTLAVARLPQSVPLFAVVSLGGTPTRPTNDGNRLVIWICEDPDDVPLVTSGTAGRYAIDMVAVKVTP